ncbi:MAG: 2,3-diketo-5-methylthio-1-phosphopentane phosphatase [Dehalococcoidia bacterium]|jgi:2-hydroxy-3-keto-5-methylthiopentenyl-1-phosphate phosphatase|nr:MAG: 2,3-diketo-5-methylthio-1-phosphopentane phosphatase [Dehalococcoidia bacterium]
MKNILIQLDFDGTVTCEDQAYTILDAYAPGLWRQHLEDYRQERITVGEFNRRAFALVHENEAKLVEFVLRHARLRRGFKEFVEFCHQTGLKCAIISNGLDFYINTILQDAGITGVEVRAARTRFTPEGIRVSYPGPDGEELESGFKEAYVRYFLAQGYRIIYVGNGWSDIFAARLAEYIFACDDLLSLAGEEGLPVEPFGDFNDVRKGLERLMKALAFES